MGLNLNAHSENLKSLLGKLSDNVYVRGISLYLCSSVATHRWTSHDFLSLYFSVKTIQFYKYDLFYAC